MYPDAKRRRAADEGRPAPRVVPPPLGTKRGIAVTGADVKKSLGTTSTVELLKEIDHMTVCSLENCVASSSPSASGVASSSASASGVTASSPVTINGGACAASSYGWPPPPPPAAVVPPKKERNADEGGGRKWERWREGSGRYGDRGGRNKQWYSDYYTAKAQGKLKEFEERHGSLLPPKFLGN